VDAFHGLHGSFALRLFSARVRDSRDILTIARTGTEACATALFCRRLVTEDDAAALVLPVVPQRALPSRAPDAVAGRERFFRRGTTPSDDRGSGAAGNTP
jgi:hypothetical protein